MDDVNVIDWHIHLLRVDQWLEVWLPSVQRALAFGAVSSELTRSEEDPHHFRQTTRWRRREDFDRFWQSPELVDLRQQASGWYNVPVLPHWERLVAEGDANVEGETTGEKEAEASEEGEAAA